MYMELWIILLSCCVNMKPQLQESWSIHDSMNGPKIEFNQPTLLLIKIDHLFFYEINL